MNRLVPKTIIAIDTEEIATPYSCKVCFNLSKMTKMSRNLTSFKHLVLVAFIGFQTRSCEGISPGEDSGTSSPRVPEFNGTLYAVCDMRPSPTLPELQPQIYGHVLFKQNSPKGALMAMLSLHGFPYIDNQSRAIHIHEYGDLTDGCTSCGGHYNPLKVDHPNHPGDFGNFESHLRRIRQMQSVPATLFGSQSVLGRAVVIHEKEDDMGLGGDEGSLLHGNAGRRLACCTIAITSSKHWDKAGAPGWEEVRSSP
ncbi:hypothetical protein AGOR_G00186040 [Albula goreensis]|uniref:Superoxide dismutase [Cu-Zn] n=1 Tax=Albula goreensis TaxID=1534307 RepID=A0A8T3CXX3_9TELE|nr:hypothetical protein AGOR_G00186040 [Albula goreensis]